MNTQSTNLKTMAGIGYRHQIGNQIMQNKHLFDCLEITVEHYINPFSSPNHSLNELTDNFIIIPHGLDLSIGSISIDRDYLINIKKISDQLNCNYYTDHLCITRSPGIKFSHLTPIIYNESYLKRITANVAYVQDFLGKQLVLENITTPFNLEKMKCHTLNSCLI
jgi:uncharacterized protein